MKDFLLELLYHTWLRYEKLVVWWWGHTRKEEHEERVVWKYRRECPEGIRGYANETKPQGLLSRMFNELLWRIGCVTGIVRRIERGDW